MSKDELYSDIYNEILQAMIDTNADKDDLENAASRVIELLEERQVIHDLRVWKKWRKPTADDYKEGTVYEAYLGNEWVKCEVEKNGFWPLEQFLQAAEKGIIRIKAI